MQITTVLYARKETRMKLTYETATLAIILFEDADVIETSGIAKDDTEYDGEWT